MVSLVNELFAALDSDPALMEAARARLLSREILELPQTMARLAESHARLAESQNLALAELADAGTRGAKPGALEVAFAAFRADVISRFVETDSRIDRMNEENAKLRGEFAEFRMEVREKFAELNARIGDADRRVDATNVRIDDMNARIDATNVRIDETNARIDETNAELAKLRREFEDFKDEVNARFDRIEARLDALTRDMKTVRNDVGSIKGWVARFEFDRDREDFIIEETGFESVEIVSRAERREMMRTHGDILGATKGERRSFVRADALARVVDSEGRDAFLAVEVSYTVHWQDTSRAIRNAGFLTKITGLPAYAAVAGTRVNARSQRTVDSGEVLFMEMEDRAPREDEEDEDEE